MITLWIIWDLFFLNTFCYSCIVKSDYFYTLYVPEKQNSKQNLSSSKSFLWAQSMYIIWYTNRASRDVTVRHIKHNTTNATTSSANNNAFIKTRTLESLSKCVPSNILEFILVSQTNVCISHHLYSHLWWNTLLYTSHTIIKTIAKTID